ncbi:MAG: 50S ribosomal protein L18 [Patescibacteria group bacterium]
MKNLQKIKVIKRKRRHKRVRARIFGTIKRPRLSIFRSHKHIYAQLIDDERGKTLVSTSDFEFKNKQKEVIAKEKDRQMSNKVRIAYKVGKLIAEKSLAKNIKEVVFDRGGYKYHGRVKALAEGAREGGLKF